MNEDEEWEVDSKISRWWKSIDWTKGFAMELRRQGIGLGVISILGVIVVIANTWPWLMIVAMVLVLGWCIGLMVTGS